MSIPDSGNFMAEIYSNPNINRYTEGPGALLDTNCQPGALATARPGDPAKYVLCIKKVPSGWSERELERVLSDHGQIVRISKSNKSHITYWFAECKTINDMEAILKGMANNVLNMEVTVKTDKKHNDGFSNNTINNSRDIKSENNREIDMTRRTLKNFVKNPTYESSNNDNNKSNHRNRSSRVRKSSNKSDNMTTNEIKKKAQLCNGSFNAENETFESLTKKLESISYGTCKLCGVVCVKYCERCHEFYCSTDCQIKNWPQHRFYCFKMPNLVSPNVNTQHRTITNKVVPINMTNEGKKLQSTGAKSQKSNSQNSTDNLNERKPINSQNENDLSNRKQTHNSTSVNQSNGIIENKTNERCVNKRSAKFEVQKNMSTQNASLASEKKISLNRPQKASIPNSDTPVILTHIHTSNRVVIRSGEEKEREDYVKLVNKVNSSATNSKTLKDLPKQGSFCLATYDNWYYRAEILKVNSKDDIEVLYIDFGNIENKKLSDLKALSVEFYEYKQYPFEVELKNCKDLVLNSIANEYLTKLVDNSILLKVHYNKDDITTDGKLLVDLRIIQKNESINQAIMKMLAFEMPNENDPIFKGDDIIYKEIDINETKNLIVLDVSLIIDELIFVIPEQYMEELQMFNNQLKEYALKNNHSICPRPEEMCVAKYNGEWRRAICYETVGDGYPGLEFIDYGDVCAIPLENIRKYPKRALFPCYSMHARIEGIKDIIDPFLEKIDVTKIQDHFNKTLLHKVITPDSITKPDDSINKFSVYDIVVSEFATNISKDLSNIN